MMRMWIMYLAMSNTHVNIEYVLDYVYSYDMFPRRD